MGFTVPASPGTPLSASSGIISTRRQFGTNATPSDDDVVTVGNQVMTVKNAIAMQLLAFNESGELVETAPASAPEA